MIKTVDDIMYDFDGEKYELRFCQKVGCEACDGVDYSGEPNGYGCPSCDEYVMKSYLSLLKSRLKKLGTPADDIAAIIEKERQDFMKYNKP